MDIYITIIKDYYRFEKKIMQTLANLGELEKKLHNPENFIAIDLFHAAAIINRYDDKVQTLNVLYGAMDNLNKNKCYTGSLLKKLAKKEKINWFKTKSISEFKKRVLDNLG